MSNTQSPDVVRACVVSGGITTPYRVAGRGRPLVVLSFDAATTGVALSTAAPDHRVIAPDFLAGTPATDAARTSPRTWLVAFLEALGLTEVRLLVDASLATEVRRFAQLYPELVAAVSVLPPSPAALAYALAHVLVWYAVARWMDGRGIYLKV